MEPVFLRILNMSLVSCYAIGAVLVVRLLLRKAPKVFSYALWSVVLFRLACPVSFHSLFSVLLIDVNPIPGDILLSGAPHIHTGISGIDAAANTLLASHAVRRAASLNPIQLWAAVGGWIWIAGTAAVLVYGTVSLIRLRFNLVGTVRWRGNIYLADRIAVPFVLGVIHPRIYLPSALCDHERDYIILHEQTHIRRWDHVLKLAAFLALTVHWFNPLVWLAYLLFVKDMEMSCDEYVLKHMDTDVRRQYSASLLSFATGKRAFAAAPLAFGEPNTKSRIKNALSYKRPAIWVVIAAAAVCVVCIACLVANPPTGEKFTHYTFDDSRRGVKFSIEYPENWKLIDQRGWDGDETQEASPDTGIQFSFSEDGSETFSIAAMLTSSIAIDHMRYKSEDFSTSNGLKGKKYIDSDEKRTSIFYLFGPEVSASPLYFASVNMSTKVYKQHQADIERVMMRFTVLTGR